MNKYKKSHLENSLSQEKIRLVKPMICNKADFLKCLNTILANGYLTQGKYVEEFEKVVADYVGVKYAVAVSSGTAALHLALLACGIGKRDRVIVPDFTFPATVNVVELVGAEPELLDIDLDTFNLSTKMLKDFLFSSYNRKNVKAIIPVHQFGSPADMEKIQYYAKKYKLMIIEDAACALGAKYQEKKVGAIGDVGIFSFHPRKVISTGEGGMIVTNHKIIAQRCTQLRNHGLVKRQDKMAVNNIGFNYRLAEIPALLGIVQMQNIERIIKKRINLAKLYQDSLSGVPFLTLPKRESNTRHTFQTYAVLVNKSSDRDKIKLSLNKSDIEAGTYEYTVHRQPYYKRKYKLKDNRFKNSLLVSKRILILPLFPELTEREIKKITHKIRSYFYGD